MRDPKKRRAAGFTLIELMIVILILGVLAAIALPNFVRMRQNAKRVSCLSNQRNLGEAGVIYASENNVVNAVINVSLLHLGGYITRQACECPESPNLDYDDYTMRFVSRRIGQLRCDIRPARHAYVFPN